MYSARTSLPRFCLIRNNWHSIKKWHSPAGCVKSPGLPHTPRTLEAIGLFQLWDHHGLYSKSQASPGYIGRPSLKSWRGKSQQKKLTIYQVLIFDAKRFFQCHQWSQGYYLLLLFFCILIHWYLSLCWPWKDIPHTTKSQHLPGTWLLDTCPCYS